MKLLSILAGFFTEPRSVRGMLLLGLVLLFLTSCSQEHPKSIRLPSQKPSPASSEMGSGDLYAVVVGVANYNHSKIPGLRFADKDAKDFAAFLKNQKGLFRKMHVRPLINQQATRVEIEKSLVDLRQAGENDTVIVYLSGHGADDPRSPGEFFFLPYDADPDYLAPSSVNMSRQEYLQKLSSKRVLLVADTCHSGGFPAQATKGIEPSFERFVRQIKDTKGRIVLSASRADEVSLERVELGNGVFTHFLLEGLRGAADANHDGVVTLHELYAYVHEKTKDITNGIQHPRFIGDLDGPFPLSLVGSEAALVRDSKRTEHPILQRPQPSELERLQNQAAGGNAGAQFELGLKYEHGLGVPKDKSEAIKWYFKSSEQGNSDAQAALARLSPTNETSPGPSSHTSPSGSESPGMNEESRQWLVVKDVSSGRCSIMKTREGAPGIIAGPFSTRSEARSMLNFDGEVVYIRPKGVVKAPQWLIVQDTSGKRSLMKTQDGAPPILAGPFKSKEDARKAAKDVCQ